MRVSTYYPANSRRHTFIPISARSEWTSLQGVSKIAFTFWPALHSTTLLPRIAINDHYIHYPPSSYRILPPIDRLYCIIRKMISRGVAQKLIGLGTSLDPRGPDPPPHPNFYIPLLVHGCILLYLYM